MNNENEKITYYYDWLTLDKKEFHILSMLADVGEFNGNLSDICNYFHISVQQNHRETIKKSIETLTDGGYITSNKSGNAYTIRVVPKDNEIKIYRKWVHRIMNRKNKEPSVAWEQVLKLYLLYSFIGQEQLVTDAILASHLNTSESTISSAKKVLSQEFAAIIQEVVHEKRAENYFVTLGHEVQLTAWWNK